MRQNRILDEEIKIFKVLAGIDEEMSILLDEYNRLIK